MKKTEIIAAVFSMILFVAASAFGAGGNTILGKTDRTETWLEKAGISLETAYKGEFWTNLRGGFTQAQTHLHQADFTASLNTKKAGLWDNGRLFINVLSNQGEKLLTEQIVGDCQTVSNIEAPPATRLYQLWYEHLLFDENLSLLFGIHDLNSEFAVTEHGALFINSSFGISKDISGGARPGIFPLASPALRAKYIPNRSWEFLVGLYHGNPGDPRIQRRLPRFALYGQAGVLINAETAYRFSHDSLPGTIKAGFWRNTGTFEDILEVDQTGIPRSHKGNKGMYLVADKMLYADEPDRGLGAFMQFGWAPDANINEYNSYVGAGLRFMGMIPLRRGDEAGIAVAHALLNGKLADCRDWEGAETTIEITYRAVINKHIAIQPDIQFAFNPAADPSIKNAVVAGVRFEISF